MKTIEDLRKERQESESKSASYFANLKLANSIEELGNEPEEFEYWCYWKYREMEIKTRTSKEIEANPDLNLITQRLTHYPADLSWAISQFFMISKALSKLEDEKQHWHNQRHLQALRALKEQGHNAPALKTIEAYIEQNYNDEWKLWLNEIQDVELKKLSLEKHLNVWMKLDKIYCSLIYDLNSEFYRTYSKYVKQSPNSKGLDDEFKEFMQVVKQDYKYE